MDKLDTQYVEDINISFNKDIYSYVIDISYRHTDSEGNVDITSISDLPIPLANYPDISRSISYNGCDTKIDLGFGYLDFHRITKQETRRIYTATKEMTIEEIEKKLGHKVKIVNKKEA